MPCEAISCPASAMRRTHRRSWPGHPAEHEERRLRALLLASSSQDGLHAGVEPPGIAFPVLAAHAGGLGGLGVEVLLHVEAQHVGRHRRRGGRLGLNGWAVHDFAGGIAASAFRTVSMVLTVASGIICPLPSMPLAMASAAVRCHRAISGRPAGLDHRQVIVHVQRVRQALDGPTKRLQRLGIVTEQVGDPSLGIEEGGHVRLHLDGGTDHRLGFIQLGLVLRPQVGREVGDVVGF